MIATVPGWPARPVFQVGSRMKSRMRLGTDVLGRAMEVVGLVVFVAVLGLMPVIVALFAH